MQGVHPVRRPQRGLLAAGSALALCLLALTAPTAAAHVFSRVSHGGLVARSDEAADIIRISCGVDLLVNVDGLDPTTGPARCSSIRRVFVYGFGGPDTINVTRVGPRNGFTNAALRDRFAVRLFGGASSDRVSASRLDDLIDGGEGNDVLRGRDGEDLIHGGPGSDRLIGGRGADRLFGGPGGDLLQGGAGRDLEVNP
jgi:RTX calcium-binding nonapeptide repeat (4 copies)